MKKTPLKEKRSVSEALHLKEEDLGVFITCTLQMILFAPKKFMIKKWEKNPEVQN